MKNWLIPTSLLLALTVGCEAGESEQVAGNARTRHAAADDTDAGASLSDADGGEDERSSGGSGGTAARRPAAGGSGGAAADKSSASGSGGAAARRPAADGSGGAAADKSSAAGSGGAAARRPAADGGGAAGSDEPGTRGDAGPSTGDEPVPSNEIEVVGFDNSPSGSDPRPIIMFRGGYATYNVSVITSPIDVATDVMEHPKAWYHWRRGTDGLELETNQGFYKLPYAQESLPVPAGTMLDGIFEHGSVNDAGISAVIQTIARVQFEADGTFRACDGVKTTIVQTGMWRKETTPRAGTYAIDGYTIHITYEDGSQERTPLFIMHNEAKFIWLKDSPYGTPSALPDAICVLPN